MLETDVLASGEYEPGAVPSCRDVCFHWIPSSPQPAASLSPVDTAVACNKSGAAAGRCPDGFSCKQQAFPTTPPLFREEFWWITDAQTTWPVCVPDDPEGPWSIVVDLVRPPEEQGVEVELTFRVQGATWPDGPGVAGQMSLIRRSDAKQLTVPLPHSADGLVALTIPAGTWDVYFAHGDLMWPWIGRTGVLEVVASGTTILDVDAVSVPLTLTVDGQEVTAVPPEAEYLEVWLQNKTLGTYVPLRYYPDESLPSAIVVEAGTWDVILGTDPDALPGLLPPASARVLSGVELEQPGDRLDIVARTVHVQGRVLVDGADPPERARITMRWSADGMGPDPRPTTLGRARPTAYARHLWDARYDVSIAGSGSGVPDGQIFVRRGAPAMSADYDIATRAVDGVVLVNGEAHDQLFTANLSFDGADVSSSIRLGDGGTYAGLVWDAPAAASLEWFYIGTASLRGIHLPETGSTFDLKARKVTIALTLDGEADPSRSYAWNSWEDAWKGYVQFWPVDSVTGSVLASGDWPSEAHFPSDGPLIASTLMTPGTYQATAHGYEVESFDGPPANFWLDLGTIVVAGDDLAIRHDAVSRMLDVLLLADGAELPPDIEDQFDRGDVQLGSTRLALPAEGPAQASLRFFPTPLASVSWMCGQEGWCEPGPLPYETSPALVSGLAFR